MTPQQLGTCTLPALLLACSACSPVGFALRAQAAERAVQDAASARSEEHAPYELVLSRLYLEKAREEASEAHYALALDLAARAEQSARRAQVLARARMPGAVE